MTQAIAKRIVNLFETLGFTPEQIAEEENCALAIVKSVLFTSSTVYRNASKKEKSLKYTEDECTEMRQLILKQARETEDEHLAFKARKWVVDDFEGRFDTEKNVQNFGSFNVINFNMQHQKTIEAMKRTQERAVEINSSIKSNEELIVKE